MSCVRSCVVTGYLQVRWSETGLMIDWCARLRFALQVLHERRGYAFSCRPPFAGDRNCLGTDGQNPRIPWTGLCISELSPRSPTSTSAAGKIRTVFAEFAKVSCQEWDLDFDSRCWLIWLYLIVCVYAWLCMSMLCMSMSIGKRIVTKCGNVEHENSHK